MTKNINRTLCFERKLSNFQSRLLKLTVFCLSQNYNFSPITSTIIRGLTTKVKSIYLLLNSGVTTTNSSLPPIDNFWGSYQDYQFTQDQYLEQSHSPESPWGLGSQTLEWATNL